MAQAHITLSDGTDFGAVDVPEWMAPSIPDYFDSIEALRVAAEALGAAEEVRSAAEAGLLAAQQAFATARQNVEAIMGQIMQNIGGN